MKKYAADCGFDFPYLYDGETQAVAKGVWLFSYPARIPFRCTAEAALQGTL
jgi:hypothetical protein